MARLVIDAHVHAQRFTPGYLRRGLGEADFDPERAAEEVDFWLSKGFTGVGEMLGMLPAKRAPLSVEENMRLLWPTLEVCRKHQAPVLFHTGCIAYPDTCRLRAVDPLLLDDIALAFPEIPIIVGHAGVQTGWYTTFSENALMVAARHPNVYLELSQCQQSQIERALHDPNIGADKLLFGSDWGASISYRYYGKDKTYAATPANEPPTVLPLHMDWNLRQIRAIEMSEDDRAKILGLNMARICKLDVKAILQRKEERYGRGIGWEEITVRWKPPGGGR